MATLLISKVKKLESHHQEDKTKSLPLCWKWKWQSLCSSNLITPFLKRDLPMDKTWGRKVFWCDGLFCFRRWSFCLYFKSMYLNLEIRKGTDLAKSWKLVFDLTKKEKALPQGGNCTWFQVEIVRFSFDFIWFGWCVCGLNKGVHTSCG